MTASPGGTTAAISLTADEDGTYYYIVQEASKKAPSISDIKKGDGQFNGSGLLKMDNPVAFTVNNLDQLKDYIIYVVVIDSADNVSNRAEASFKTKDGTPPSIKSLKGEAMQGGKRARINFTPSELGVYSYIIKGADEAAPSADDIWRTGKRTTLKVADLQGVELIDDTLSANTSYVVYVVMDDVSGNRSPVVKSNTFATGDLDLDAPVVESMTVTDILKDPTKVLITFNEKMDKATAENVANYVLGGTGNLTGKPLKATLSSNGRGVTLEIPSMAAFVFNDTLTVKISKVQDEAGNEIVETTETYTYKAGETSDPKIDKLAVKQYGPTNTLYVNKEVTFEANAAGSYYYLIVPIDPNDTLKKPERSDVIFPNEYLKENSSKINFSLTGNANAVPRQNTFTVTDINRNDPRFKSHPYGYMIYVAFQDRNGNFGDKVLEAVFVGDESAPNIINNTFIFAGTSKSPTGPASTEDYQALNQFYYRPDINGVADSDKETFFKFEMEFDEQMDKTSIENIANYEISGTAFNNGKVKLVNAELDATRTKATLTFQAFAKLNEEKFIEYNLIKDETLTIGFKQNTIYDYSKVNPLLAPSQTFTYEDKVKPKLKSTQGMRLMPNRTVEW